MSMDRVGHDHDQHGSLLFMLTAWFLSLASAISILLNIHLRYTTGLAP